MEAGREGCTEFGSMKKHGIHISFIYTAVHL